MSETPISDSTPHNVAELGMLCRRLERLAAVRLAYITQLETENDAANAEIARLTSKVAQLYEGAEEQNQRIKRLEEALDKTSKAACKHIKQLESEVYALRLYGNKDCTAMADQALKEAKL